MWKGYFVRKRSIQQFLPSLVSPDLPGVCILVCSCIQRQHCACVFPINVKWPRSAIAAPIPRVLTLVGQTFVFHSRRGCFLLPKQALADIGKRSHNCETYVLSFPALRQDLWYTVSNSYACKIQKERGNVYISTSDMKLSIHTHKDFPFSSQSEEVKESEKLFSWTHFLFEIQKASPLSVGKVIVS